MADTNQQRTWFGINDESAWKTEKGERGKVACPLYRFLYLSRNDALFGGGGNDLIVGGGDVNFADNYAAASERLVV